MVRNRKYSVHRANFIGLARSRFLCGGGMTRWGQAWGPRDRNVTILAKTSTRAFRFGNWNSFILLSHTQHILVFTHRTCLMKSV